MECALPIVSEQGMGGGHSRRAQNRSTMSRHLALCSRAGLYIQNGACAPDGRLTRNFSSA